MLRFLRYIVPLTLLLACQNERLDSSAHVYIAKHEGQSRFWVNNKPFQIKGLSGSSHLADAAAIGANTIRTYDTTGLAAILDSAQKHGLMVVAGIWLPKSQVPWLYQYEEQYLKLGKELAALGRKHRDHPALLSWCLGNELVYYDFLDWKFARAYNLLLDSLQSGDPNHPIGTAFANYGKRSILNFSLKIRDLDYMLINTFGRLPMLEEDRSSLNWFWPRPYLIGEFGENGPWETEWTSWGVPIEPKSSQKAKVLSKRFAALPDSSPDYLGALVFNWGWRQEQTHTWFNTFSEKGERNAMYYFLQKQYSGNQSHPYPVIDTLLLDGSHQLETFFFETGEEHQAQLKFHPASDRDSLHINWSIRAEDWYFLKADTPPALPDLIIEESDSLLRFKCPPKPGPYRLFVKITDGKGNFASANIPFYVVQ
jgi:hypothetical protein